MPAEYWPAVQRRLLTGELRPVRRAAELTLEQAAAALCVPVSGIQGIENGAGVPVPALRALLEVYGIAGPGRAEEMTALAVGAAARTWPDSHARAIHDRTYLTVMWNQARVATGN
jgi:hypothetical protein